MPETACPSLLPLNYLPVSLKKSGCDPGRLSGEEREVHLNHWLQFTMGQILLKHANNKGKVHPNNKFMLNGIFVIVARKSDTYLQGDEEHVIRIDYGIRCPFRELVC